MNHQNSFNYSMTRRSMSKKEISGKENDVVVTKLGSSTRRVEQMFNDVRISACKTITNVKSSLDDISQKLKGPIKKTRSFSKMQQYKEMSECVTPVKLYAPFTFVTPSPPKSTPKRVSPRRFSFKSPSNRFRKDVQQLNKELKELEKVQKTICARKLR